MFYVWWDQKSVVYDELLKPRETVNAERYQQQLIDLNRPLLEKGPEYRRRQQKVIVFPSHTAKPVCDTSEALNWKVLPSATYSPDSGPSDYYYFASMSHANAEQRFGSYEDVKKWLDERFAARGEDFYCRSIHKLLETLRKCTKSDGAHFE